MNENTQTLNINWDKQLMDAIKSGDMAAFDEALAHNAWVNCFESTETFTNLTPLYYAADFGRLEMAQKLVDHGADPQAKIQPAMGRYDGASAPVISVINVAKRKGFHDIAFFLENGCLPDKTQNDFHIKEITPPEPKKLTTQELEFSVRLEKRDLARQTR